MKEQTRLDQLLKKVRRIHMIGIGGSGMAPLAEILHSRGYQLTGSDNNESDTLARMRSLGIPVVMGHFPENVGDAELVVHSAAIMKDNPEIVQAAKLGVPAIERSFLLGAVTREYDRVIAVSGTHGKTTVSAMLTHILLKCGRDPSAVIGGRLPLIDANGRAGQSDLLVCEACEYVDTFLKMAPDAAVILNIDNDHLEYFGSMENLVASFRKFAMLASDALILGGDDERVLTAAEGLEKKRLTFGFSPKNEYYPKEIETKGRQTRFTMMRRGEKAADVTISVPGRHNVLNALAALAAADYAGVAPAEAAAALKDFTGAGRRFEILGQIDGVTVADDYAHHPAELRATLTTAAGLDYGRVVAIFQPFTYSRTKMLMEEFAEVLRIPDLVILSEIMGSREINTWGVYSSQLAEKIPDCVWFDTFEEIADYAAEIARPGDLMITLGCGDIYKAAKTLLNKLKQRENKEEVK